MNSFERLLCGVKNHSLGAMALALSLSIAWLPSASSAPDDSTSTPGMTAVAPKPTKLSATQGKYYPNDHGGTIYFPLGEASFADEVVKFEKGDPSAEPAYSEGKNLLGPPDYKYGTNDSSPCALTLGCGGKVVVRFTDNVLVDVKGPDLYVFEVGDDIENMDLAISEDGRKWIDLGTINGGTAAVDIAAFVLPGEVFHYVRLIDLKSHCEGPYPGADIDAVGAIGSGEKLLLKNSVLFGYNEASVKPGARSALHEVAQHLKLRSDARVIVEGHTDNVGSDTYNQKLSEARAKAVRDYLVDVEGLTALKIETRGYGSTRPVALNTTELGREQNRRVEIIIMPAAPKPSEVVK